MLKHFDSFNTLFFQKSQSYNMVNYLTFFFWLFFCFKTFFIVIFKHFYYVWKIIYEENERKILEEILESMKEYSDLYMLQMREFTVDSA